MDCRVITHSFFGARGVRHWFRLCGYLEKKSFLFLYPIDAYAEESLPSVAKKLNLIFVGQLIRRKDLDVLLHALAHVKDIPWNSSVIGSGSKLNAVRSMVWKFGWIEKLFP